MALLQTDVYGNKSPGADFAPLSAKWDTLTVPQQLARIDFLHQSGYYPTMADVLEKDGGRSFFTSENVDVWHDLLGGPKPQHKGPGAGGGVGPAAYNVGKVLQKLLPSIIKTINPAYGAIVDLATNLTNELARPGPKFRGTEIIKLIDLAVPAVQGIGGGLLGLQTSGYLGSQPITRNPLASVLITGGGGIVAKLLAR